MDFLGRRDLNVVDCVYTYHCDQQHTRRTHHIGVTMSGAPKKSLLSAALSGAPTPAVAPPPPAPAGLGSLEAFPCLLHAPDDGTSLEGLTEGINSIDLSRVQIVGSVPTNTTLPNGRQLVGTLPVPWMGVVAGVQCGAHACSLLWDRRQTTHWTLIVAVEAKNASHPVSACHLQLAW